MAQYGMYTEAIGNRTRQTNGILLDRKNDDQLRGEIVAVNELNKQKNLGFRVVEKLLCFGHHEPTLAKRYYFIEVLDESTGKLLAKEISYAGQLLKHGNPNNKELFPQKKQ